MRRPPSANLICSLAIAMLVGCAAAPSRNSLSELIAAASPCSVRLHPVWVGTAHDMVATGYFATAGENTRVRHDRYELRFDRFDYSEQPPPDKAGPKTIAQSAGGDGLVGICTYRASLPSDGEIAKAATVQELARLLGPSQGFTDGWENRDGMHSTAAWAFFAMHDGESLETVDVFCMVTMRRRGGEQHIDSMRITRGIARPENSEKAAGNPSRRGPAGQESISLAGR